MSGNIIEDETLLIFTEKLNNNLKIEQISLTSCKLGDLGVISLLDGISKNKNYIKLDLRDNFISEKSEKKIIELLENSNLIRLNLKGNRITPSTLNKISKICKKNYYNLKNKEPLKLKRKINRMNFEKKKIKNWEKQILKIKNDIQVIDEKKASLELELNSFKEDFVKRKEKLEEQINSDLIIKEEKELELEKILKEIKTINQRFNSEMSIHQKYYDDVIKNEKELINKKQLIEERNNNKISNFDIKRKNLNQKVFKWNETISELIEEENIMKNKIKQLNEKTYFKSLKS